MAEDPIARFIELFGRAEQLAAFDHTAAALATAAADGRPSVRVVLVRHIDPRGFVFFTNYRSRKARDIAENAAASLCFYWPWLDEQVRVEGSLEMVTPEESDEYFAGRPRGSQIGAWASLQSEPLAGRDELEARYFAVEREYEGRPVPRPPHWGGYRLVPAQIEFWKAGQYRLHDRWLYTRQGDAWRVERLYP